MTYKFDFNKIKARERKQFAADMQRVDTDENGDELLIKWIARAGVDLPKTFDWTDPAKVLDAMGFAEYMEVMKAFTGAFQGLFPKSDAA